MNGAVVREIKFTLGKRLACAGARNLGFELVELCLNSQIKLVNEDR